MGLGELWEPLPELIQPHFLVLLHSPTDSHCQCFAAASEDQPWSSDTTGIQSVTESQFKMPDSWAELAWSISATCAFILYFLNICSVPGSVDWKMNKAWFHGSVFPRVGRVSCRLFHCWRTVPNGWMDREMERLNDLFVFNSSESTLTFRHVLAFAIKLLSPRHVTYLTFCLFSLQKEVPFTEGWALSTSGKARVQAETHKYHSNLQSALDTSPP